MHLQNLLAPDHVRIRHDDLPVEAAGAQQRRVEHVRAVGRGDQDDAFVRLEAVHLDEQLVQRLLALVVAAAKARAAMPADGVDLVDEDDARRILLRLLEHVAHAARADADEHLDEIGAGNREEGNVRLAGDGARKQRLAGARRSDQKHATRNAPAEPLKLLRIAQELDDLLEVLLRLIDARDVVEGDAAMRLRQQLRLGLAEAHGASAGALHLPHEENPHGDQKEHREPGDQHRQERHFLVVRARLDGDAAILKQRHVVGVLGSGRAEARAVLVFPGDLLTRDDDALDPPVIRIGAELRIGDFLGAGLAGGILEQIEEGDQQKQDHGPERKIPKILVHSVDPRGRPEQGRQLP